MELLPEQKQTVAQWIAAGDSLSTVQQKLTEQFKLSLTYMEVRFLVDDLNLQLQDPVPATEPAKMTDREADASGATARSPEKKGFLDKMKEKVGLGGKEEPPPAAAEDVADEDFAAEEDFTEAEAATDSTVKVAVDQVTLIPGAVASGSVTFSDGVTGKWIIDQYGRPGFTEISRPGYRPAPADAQAFMQELGRALQARGF